LLTEELPQRLATQMGHEALDEVAALYREIINTNSGWDRGRWDAPRQAARKAYAATPDAIGLDSRYDDPETTEGAALVAVRAIADYYTPYTPRTPHGPPKSALSFTVSTIARLFAAPKPIRVPTPTAEAAAAHRVDRADCAIKYVAIAASADARSAAREAYCALHSSPRTTYAAAHAAYRAFRGRHHDVPEEIIGLYYAARSAGRSASKSAGTACYLRQFDKVAELLALDALDHLGPSSRGDWSKTLGANLAFAEQAHPRSQYKLCVMYARGLGVPQDYVQAHMWLSLAAAFRAESWRDPTLVELSDDADKARDLVAAKMTPDQIAEAQRMAREWKPKK